MLNFFRKKIERSLEVGDVLREFRLYKRWSLQDVARKTRIKISYLKALEDDHFEIIPTGVYRVNFLRRYSAVLGISKKEVKKLLEVIQDYNRLEFKSEKFIFRKAFKSIPTIAIDAIFRFLLTALIFGILFFYLAHAASGIFSVPKIDIQNPPRDLIVSSKIIDVSGLVEPETEVSINGEFIENNNGTFKVTINLRDGVNLIIIKAKRKYGQENTVTRRILVKE